MSRFTVDRRMFLKGLGASAGLAASFFGSKVAMGQTSEAPLRVLLVALTHGWGVSPGLQADRQFSGSEYDFVIPEALKAFNAIKDQVVFIDGARGTLWGNAHDVSYADIFTAAVPWDDTGSDQLGTHFPDPMGPSLDHVIGAHHNKPVLRVSANYRSWGRKSNPICFDDQFKVLDSYFNPQSAYDALIEPLKANAQAPMPGRDAIRQNLFDYLGKDTDRLLKKVQGEERSKLESYLSAVNDLSERLFKQSQIVISADDIPERPMQSPAFERMIDDYFDMIQLAFRADTHRVAVLGFGEGTDDWTWRDKNGVVSTGNPWGSDFHHHVAHYSNQTDDPDWQARRVFEGWVDWYSKKIVQLTQRLAATPDIDGKSLLDNTLIVLTGEVGDGQHNTRSKLHTLIGGGDRLKRGRWIKAEGVPARMRNGVFIGGTRRDGTEVTSGLNYGPDLSVWHTADVLAEVARLAGVPTTTFGLEANNRSPVPLKLS